MVHEGRLYNPRTIIGVIAILVFLAFAITQAVLVVQDHTDLPPPKTAEEAISSFNTQRFRNMSQSAREQYAAQAAFMVDELPGEKRRQYFRSYFVPDECRNIMIKSIAEREFQKAVSYSQAQTETEKLRILDAHIDKLVARFNALSPEFRDANQITIAILQTSSPGTPGPAPHMPFPAGGGWFSRIRNYALENPEYQKPENAKLIADFNKAANARLVDRHIVP